MLHYQLKVYQYHQAQLLDILNLSFDYFFVAIFFNVTYLRRFDDKIWKAEYGDRLKLHIGILFKIDSLAYTLQEKATKLYSKCKNKPESSLAKRCCKFIPLQEKLLEYIEWLHLAP